MSEYKDCLICNKGSLQKSSEVIDVRSNVRDFKEEKFTVWRCSFCNSLHSKLKVDLDYYYKKYPIHEFSTKGPIMNLIFSHRLKRLKKLGLKKGHTILNFGCGNGNMVSCLQNFGYKNANGYDKYNPKYSDEKILDQKYDYIICQDVIEHSEEPRILLKNLVKMLNKNGILSIGTPNADFIDLINHKKFLNPLQQPFHRHILSEKSLILLANERGLNKKSIYHRYYLDSLIPFINHRFIVEYIYKKGNTVETIFSDKIDFKIIFNPNMMFYGIFGYFFHPNTEMEIIFELSE